MSIFYRKLIYVSVSIVFLVGIVAYIISILEGNINTISVQHTNGIVSMDTDWQIKENDDYAPDATMAKAGRLGTIGITSPDLLSPLLTSDKPNIVVIITDDQPYTHLGLAGNTIVKTPNIDALGRSGAYFTNAYLTSGHCQPSRASIWTGKLPHNNGVIHNGFTLSPDQLTISDVLNVNNYKTAIIGKCSLGDPNDLNLYTYGFDTRIIPFPDVGALEDWYNYRIYRNGTIENHNQYITDFLTDEAITYINRQSKAQPFYLWLSYFAPHAPTTPPKNSNRYNIDEISMPDSNIDDLLTKPPHQSISDMRNRYLELGADENTRRNSMREKIKDEFEVLSNVDDNIGRVIQTLKSRGMIDNTMVIFLSDNGVYYGEHGFYGKSPAMYDTQLKTPLIVSYPKLVKNNNVISSLVSSIDIFPTILDLLDINKPEEIDGISFIDLLNSSVKQSRKSIYMEYERQNGINSSAYPMRGLVMGGYKLTHYLETSINGEYFDGRDYELYDLEKDPSEVNNIAKKISPNDNAMERLMTVPRYKNIIRKLRKEIAVWATDTYDPKRYILETPLIESSLNTRLNIVLPNLKGQSTVEIEYNQKDCLGCPVREINDINHDDGDFAYTIRDLKPETVYQIRMFYFDEKGIGGYVDSEGKTTK